MKAVEGLDPRFLAQVAKVLAACARRGVEMRPYSGVRGPLEQAKLWRQGRTRQEIGATMKRLHEGGAPHLAACIGAVGPQHGKRVTGAWPGASWHNHGEAVDCLLVVNGEAEWDAAAPGWIIYAEEARMLGLKPGRDFGDSPHIQMRHGEPTAFGLVKLDAMMVARFPVDLAGLA